MQATCRPSFKQEHGAGREVVPKRGGVPQLRRFGVGLAGTPHNPPNRDAAPFRVVDSIKHGWGREPDAPKGYWSGITAFFWQLSVTESVVLSPDILGRQDMPRSLSTDPGPMEIGRPACAKCHGPMTFTGVISKPDGPDVRTFECALCNCTERITVQTGST
jgi:hypothetical protein